MLHIYIYIYDISSPRVNSEWFPAVANSVVVWTLLAGGVATRLPLFLQILLCNDPTFMLPIFSAVSLFEHIGTFRTQQLHLLAVNIFS